jgi:hypothetical protein
MYRETSQDYTPFFILNDYSTRFGESRSASSASAGATRFAAPA